MTGCKRVLLEPTPMRVAGRELVVIRIKAAPTAAPAGSNGTGPKAATDEKPRADAPAADNGPEAMGSS